MVTHHIPWLRVLGEGVLIVGSILVAAVLISWWEGRQAAELEHGYLIVLLDDVEATIDEVERVIELQHAANLRGDSVLSVLRAQPQLPDSSLDEVWFLLFNAYALEAVFVAYEALVASGGVEELGDPEVRRALAKLQNQWTLNERIEPWYVSHGAEITPIMAGLQASEDDGPGIKALIAAGEVHRVWRGRVMAVRRDILTAANDARDAILNAIENRP